jgi:hypothetical protein
VEFIEAGTGHGHNRSIVEGKKKKKKRHWWG